MDIQKDIEGELWKAGYGWPHCRNAIRLSRAILMNPKSNDTQAYLKWADELNIEGKFQEGEKKYLTAIQINPYEEDSYVRYGNWLLNQGRLEEAVAKYKAARALDPSYTCADYGHALIDLERFEEFNELDLPDFPFSWGGHMLRKGKTKEVEVLYSKTLAQYHNSADVYAEWAAIFQEYEHYQQALDNYKMFHKLGGNLTYYCDWHGYCYCNLYIGYGLVLYHLKRYQEVDELYQEAILQPENDIEENYPQNKRLYEYWGAGLYKKGEYEGAEIMLSKATQINPLVGSYLLWGDVLQAQNKSLEAQEKYAKAAVLGPQNQSVYHKWGYALQATGNNQEAVEKYAKSIELDPSNVDVQIALGQLLVKLERSKEAIVVYLKAIKFDRKDNKLYYHLADLLTQTRLISKGTDLLLQMYAQNSPVILNWANIIGTHPYWSDEEAEKSYEVAIKKDKMNADAYLYFARFLHIQKRYGDVDRLFEDALKIGVDEYIIYSNWADALLLQRRYEVVVKKGIILYHCTSKKFANELFSKVSKAVKDSPHVRKNLVDKFALDFFETEKFLSYLDDDDVTYKLYKNRMEAIKRLLDLIEK